MKACVDCRYHEKTITQESLCAHPRTASHWIDPVTGEPRRALFHCWQERLPDGLISWLFRSSCGPSGRWFEPKGKA